MLKLPYFKVGYNLTISDGKTVNVLLCYTNMREEFMHLEDEERLERYSVIKIKASELRSKVIKKFSYLFSKRNLRQIFLHLGPAEQQMML